MALYCFKNPTGWARGKMNLGLWRGLEGTVLMLVLFIIEFGNNLSAGEQMSG